MYTYPAIAKKERERGFTLLELVVYIAISTLIILVLFSTLISTTRSYSAIKATRLMHASVLSLSNRMSYEVRSARAVNLAGSLLGVDGGMLLLERMENEVIETRRFSLLDGRVLFEEDGIFSGYLTDKEVIIEVLRFSTQSIDDTTLVSVVVGARVEVGEYVYNEDFYMSYTLRGSY